MYFTWCVCFFIEVLDIIRFSSLCYGIMVCNCITLALGDNGSFNMIGLLKPNFTIPIALLLLDTLAVVNLTTFNTNPDFVSIIQLTW